MASSMLAGEKRWASGRRGSMTVLGKVAVPKPLNLPSQRLENHGLDPNIEIVPKGTFTWGSKSSSVVHPWSSSAGSFNTNLGAPSPSYLSGCPSSGGSSSRPSTAGSDKLPESGAGVKGLNSRPSSASGSLSSSQASVTSLRPHSADTRTCSSQLSRFAESSSSRSTAWSGVGTAQKLEAATSRNDEFSLACGDFPSLGSEKHEFGKNMPPQVDDSTRAEVNAKHVNDGGEECAPTGDDSANQHGMDTMDHFWRQTSSVPPQNVECWRGPPMGGPPAGSWYRGPPQVFPYGAPYPPGTFRPEQFPFYGPQVPVIASNSQHVHPSMPGPRGPNGEPYRPHMPDSFMPHFMAARPGYGLPSMTSDGYYVPTMNFPYPNGHNVPCMRPYVGAWHSGPNVVCNQGEPHDPGSPTSWGNDHVANGKQEKKESHATRSETSGKNGNFLGPEVRLLKGNRGTNELNSTTAISVSSNNSSLMQQIECLNTKARASDGTSKGKKSDDSKDGVLLDKVDGRGHETNEEPVIANVNKKTKPSRISPSREANERAEDGLKKLSIEVTNVNNCDVMDSSSLDGARKPNIRGHHTSMKLSEKVEAVLDGKDCDVVVANNMDADGSQSQRILMRELAKRRAKQRQEEEEQREKEQKAKALAKLDELNRRTQSSESGGRNIQDHKQEYQSEPLISEQNLGHVVDTSSSTLTSASEPSTKQQDLAADIVAGIDDVSSKYVPVNHESSLPAGACENGTTRIPGLPSEEACEKDQHTQRPLHRSNVQHVRSRDKGRHSDAVVWAPKSRESPAENVSNSERPDGKSRRAEMERYVPKPVSRNESNNPPKSGLNSSQIEFGSFNAENIPYLSTTLADVDSRKGNRRQSKQSHLSSPKDNSSLALEPAKNMVVQVGTEQMNDLKADASPSVRVKSPTVKDKRDHVKGQKRNFKNREARRNQAPPPQPIQDVRGGTEKSVSQWKPKAQAVQGHDNLGGKYDEHKQPVTETSNTEKHRNAQDGRRGKNMVREVKPQLSNQDTETPAELHFSETTDFQCRQKALPSNFRKNGQQNRRLNRRQESHEDWIADNGKQQQQGQHGQNLHLEYQPIRHGNKRFGAAGGGRDGKVDGGGY